MRAIDADALRERLLVLRSNVTNVSILDIFDICLTEVSNAPTIPQPDFKDGYKQAIIDEKTSFIVRDCGEENE